MNTLFGVTYALAWCAIIACVCGVTLAIWLPVYLICGMIAIGIVMRDVKRDWWPIIEIMMWTE